MQETRAATLWKIATASAPPSSSRPSKPPACASSPATTMPPSPSSCAVGEEYMPDMLVEHLLSVGYTQIDVVEMPGQVTLRGGILDVYSPEMDRPVRIDFFGDEIESIRKFEPEPQRCSSRLDERPSPPAHRNARHRKAARRHQRPPHPRAHGAASKAAKTPTDS